MIEEEVPRLIADLLRRMWGLRARTSDHVVVGKVVRVTDRIPPDRLGSVLIPVRGGTEEFYARSSTGAMIPVGQMVEVVAYAPPRTVDVNVVDCSPHFKNPNPEL